MLFALELIGVTSATTAVLGTTIWPSVATTAERDPGAQRDRGPETSGRAIEPDRPPRASPLLEPPSGSTAQPEPFDRERCNHEISTAITVRSGDATVGQIAASFCLPRLRRRNSK